jgi:uracil-DNA glycosylase
VINRNFILIDKEWKKFLSDTFNKSYFVNLKKFLFSEYQEEQIFPPQKLIFNAFNCCKLDDLKVVILGQDPYHDENQAHGLCFSVPQGIKTPPSLRNIFKELKNDLNIEPQTTDLTSWANQGILLLNTVLTVKAHQAFSHSSIGWQIFTNFVIEKLSRCYDNIIFVLWGKHAQDKQSLIDSDRHYILKAAHPSPLSASNGFFGCKHFSEINKILKELGEKEIVWHLDNI